MGLFANFVAGIGKAVANHVVVGRGVFGEHFAALGTGDISLVVDIRCVEILLDPLFMTTQHFPLPYFEVAEKLCFATGTFNRQHSAIVAWGRSGYG